MRRVVIFAVILVVSRHSGASAAEAAEWISAEHSPERPKSSQPVTITARLASAAERATLQVQIVEPGSYWRRTDAAFTNSWRDIPMSADGSEDGTRARDGLFKAIIPAEVQQHRRLVRYRINLVDPSGEERRYPAASNDCPNLAYFVYDGLPEWTGASRPGQTPPLTFSPQFMGTMPAYHLIARQEDVKQSQWEEGRYGRRFFGTLVYEGRVYDHIQFHIRGKASTYVAGKNKWGFRFNESRQFRDLDLWGQTRTNGAKSLSLNACASPWAPVNRGMAGLDEAVSFRAYQLAGVPAASTHWIQLRVIKDQAEASVDNQYAGDLWGLYQVVQEPNGDWLRENGLPDGDVYSPEAGVKHRAKDSPPDDVEFQKFMEGSQSQSNESWWRENLNLSAYYSFHALNRVLGNVDLRPGANHYLYRQPDGRWCVIPWDLDMMFIARTHQPGFVDQARCLAVPTLAIEYQNRAREVLDLFCSDARKDGGQIGQLVDELMRFLCPTNQARSWSELDMCLWNYHPRSKAQGAFYGTPWRDDRFGGQWTRRLATPDLAGFGKYIVDYCTDTRGRNNYAHNDGDQRGHGFGALLLEAQDPRIPPRPVIRSKDSPPDSSNAKLLFDTVDTPRADASSGSAKWTAIQWRLGEISAPGLSGYQPGRPRRYEIEEFWSSEKLPLAASRFTLPPSLCRPGHTYRVRARFLDSSGRAGHWSEPLQFVAP